MKSGLKTTGRILLSTAVVFGLLWTLLDPLDPFGIELLKKAGIWGYVLLWLVAVLVALVKERFFAQRPQISLMTLETALSKDRTGPSPVAVRSPLVRERTWSDYEHPNQSYLYDRPEIDAIIENLESDSRHVVEGDPASGKSVLLRSVGFKLRKKGYDVYVIDCRSASEREGIDDYIRNALNIDDPRTLILIDDYHLLVDKCDWLLRQYDNRGITKTKLLIGTRPVAQIHRRGGVYVEGLNRTKITSDEAARGLAETYLQRNLGLCGERLDDAVTLLWEHKDDLLQLSWALEAFHADKDGDVMGLDLSGMYEAVRRWIGAVAVELGERQGVEDIFVAVSILGRFDLFTEVRVLSNRLGVEEELIDRLVQRREIIRKDLSGSRPWPAVALQHSSLARLIFDSARITALGASLVDKFTTPGDNDFEKAFILDNLKHSDIFYYIDPNDLCFQEIVVPLISDNYQDLEAKLVRSFQQNVDIDRSLDDLENYLYGWRSLPQPIMAELVGKVHLERLGQRINGVSDTSRVASLFGTTQGSFLEKLVESVDLDKLAEKAGQDIEVAASVIAAIGTSHEAVALDLLRNKIGSARIKTLFEEIGEDDYIRAAGYCFSALVGVDEDLSRDLSGLVRERFGQMAESYDEDGEPLITLESIKTLLMDVVDTQALYGERWCVVAPLMDSLEEAMSTLHYEAVQNMVQISGGDLSEEEADADVTEGLREELEEILADVDRDLLARLLARLPGRHSH